MTKICVSFFVFFAYIHAGSSLDPLVDTSLGLIRGISAEDGNYSMFLGIPYATVDENNPFGASLPYIRFDSIYNAYHDPAICPQMDEASNIAVGTLDCLKLNVYVPNVANSKNKLPVAVWIYGGGFMVGYARIYNPKYLVRHDVIVVTLNYRVGTYGFLCLDIPEVSGNQGLKDQLLALRWIKNNIGAFGGDDTKITIMGESAGAASVELHMLSEHDLFHRAVLQSGSALGHWAIVPSNQTFVFMIAKRLGFVSACLKETLKFLTNVEPKLVVAATAELNITYRACVEKEFDDVEYFIHEHPELSYKPKHIPVLAGYNSREELGAILYNPHDNNTLDILESVFDFDKSDMLNIVNHFYFNENNRNEAYQSNAIDFSSDFNFNHPMQRSMLRLAKSTEKVYHYVFSYDGGRNLRKVLLNITESGAAHMDELGYLFDISVLDEHTPTDVMVTDKMTTMWTNFIKYGNPTPNVTELLPVKWTAITSDTLHYLHIGPELSMAARPFHKRLAFWDLFYKVNYHNMKAVKNYS